MDIHKKEERWRQKWKDIMGLEEIFWKQRSRIQWLIEGDRNTSFFHRSSLKHKRRNTIHSLFNDINEELVGTNETGQWASMFVTNAYTNDRAREPTELSDKLLNLIPHVLNDADNELLVCKVTEEEVKVVVFSMVAYNTPGPNGFPPTFF